MAPIGWTRRRQDLIPGGKRQPTVWWVSVSGETKGQVWRDQRNRCFWARPHDAGVESFPPGSTLFVEVREHIARVCNSTEDKVEFQLAANKPKRTASG